MTEPLEWRSAHVFYYDQDKDGLILEAIRPLFAELDTIAGVSRKYWQRHWRLGPHVRLNLRATESAWHGRVRPLIERVIGDYLIRHPSRGGASAEHDLPMHRQLAEMEQEHGPLTPWHPDNSIQYAAFDRRLHVLGTEQASDTLADFHADSTPLAFAGVELSRDTNDKFGLPVMLMFATAARGCPPIERGYISYRSHAEGFLANSSDPAGLRAKFEKMFRTNGGLLHEQLIQVMRALYRGGERPPLLEPWTELIEVYRTRAQTLHRTDQLVLQQMAAPAEVEANQGPWNKVSAFHRALLGDEQIRTELATSEWFAAYRVLLNYQYLLFNRMGITPVERFTLCYLVARTVEEAYDISIPELFNPADLIGGRQ